MLGSGQSRQNVILCILSDHRPYDTVRANSNIFTVQYFVYFITNHYYKLSIEVEKYFITVQHSRDNFVISRTFQHRDLTNVLSDQTEQYLITFYVIFRMYFKCLRGTDSNHLVLSIVRVECGKKQISFIFGHIGVYMNGFQNMSYQGHMSHVTMATANLMMKIGIFNYWQPCPN